MTRTIKEMLADLQRDFNEQTLAELVTKCDFIVGSIECKCRLMEILPEGANIIYSTYIDESPTTVYVFPKFNTGDLLYMSQESEDTDANSN